MNKELGIRDKRQARENRDKGFGMIPDSKSVIRANSARAGFTFIEVIVTVFIISLVGVLIGAFGSDVFKSNRSSQARIQAIEEARLTLRRFLEESRGASQSSTGAYAINLADDSAFIFYSDIDNDGLKERIRYFVEDDSLKRGIIKPSGNPLVYDSGNENISIRIQSLATTSIFSFFDSSDSEMSIPATASLVRSIGISLLVSIRNEDGSISNMELATRATLRNLKDNY